MTEQRTNRILRCLLRAGKAPSSLDIAKAELGFETRLLATIRERNAAEESLWVFCNRFVWRLVPAIAALVVVLICMEFFMPARDPSLATWNDPLGFELALTEQLGGGL